ncbi:MAG: glycosyltransferase family 4 protein [Candidatus Moraniibacteriota bacterium]|nr:MAG: glycosyltransferase family 4 protein [Candidatus Moranbacteria bacterium]
MIESKPKKVALVHDFLVSYGGAERVFQELCALYPEAPIYTLLANPELVEGHFKNRDIRTSWLGRLPRFLQKRYRLFLPFFPAAVESLDLREFDLVISSSGAWSKGIITRLHTTHIAYLHSPMRYAWDYHESYLTELGARGRRSILTRMLMSYLRIWDRQAAERPDVLLANSHYTQARIAKYYRREATVIYPPVTLAEETESGTGSEKRHHFLVVSRLTKSKQVMAVVEAFNKLGLPLMVVGTGPEEVNLRKMAKDNITFTGFLADTELAERYRTARALIFPSEEDFGMVAVEALSFGVPVIGLEYGGLSETLSDGRMGETFHSSAPEIIAEGVRRFLEKEGTYDMTLMKESVTKFSREQFQKEMRAAVEKF